MENQNNWLLKIGETVFTIFDRILDFVLFLAIALFFIIRIPSVQTRAVHEISEILSQKLGHEVSIERVDIKFFKDVVLDKVKVLDDKKEVLFYIGQLHADIEVFSLLNPNKLYIGTLTLVEPKANLIHYKNSERLNMTSFIEAINKLLAKKTPPKTPKAPFEFSINNIVILNGHFTYDDQRKPFITYKGMDYQHMVYDSINVTLSEISLGDTIGMHITNLSTVESRSKTRLKELSSHMTYSGTYWEFGDLTLRLGRSYLAQYVRFDFRKFSNFQYFNDSVTVTANLRNAVFYSDDIAHFAPQVANLHDHIQLSGDAHGQVKRFSAKRVNAYYGKNSHVTGNIAATGLPNIQETFVELDLQPSTINANDIKQYIPKKVYTYSRKLGTVKLEGNFLGFYDDFVANGSFVTALGNVKTDLNLKINEDTKATAYSGYLHTDNFQVGRFLDITNIIKGISLDGRIKGSGFTLDKANLAVDATIKAIHLYGYNYRNIKAKGTLKKQILAGDVRIKDPNINLTANGQINLVQEDPVYNLTTDINELNLRQLGYADYDFKIKTKATVNFTGSRLDNLLGKGYFAQTTLFIKNTVIPLDTTSILSDYQNGTRTLSFNSELADFKATGNWQYSTLFRDLNILIKEYRLNFESNDPVTNAYYRQKPQYENDQYEVNYNINLKSFNSVIQAFIPEVRISRNTQVEGNFRQGANAIFTLHSNIDTVFYGKNVFFGNEIDLNTSKLPYSPSVLANAVISSRNEVLTTGGNTENLYVEGVWNDSTIQFTSNIAQSNSTNRINLNGVLSFQENHLDIIFNNSRINILGKDWTIVPNNTLGIAGEGKEISFENFVIYQGNQQLSFNGLLSQNPKNELNISVKDFRLETLNPLLAQHLGGVLNATISITDIYRQAKITSNLTADSVMMDKFLVGTIAGTTNWDNHDNHLDINLGITRDNMKVLNVTGDYNANNKTNQLDLLAVMDNAPLKLIEPLINSLFGDLEGTMEGRLKITGELDAPLLAGSALITNGRFNFKYLNTIYTFSDRIYFTENDITFRDVKLTDVLNNTGTVSGSIIHQGFQNMILDLRGVFRRFMVLNTTREQNNVYYGTAIATGSATVLGTPSNLDIKIDARSEAGTRMSIPLDNNNTISRQSFIKFINHNASDSASVTEAAHTEIAGINMNFNLNVTPDAYIEIILDEATGDIVRGSGNGRIRMNIDTRGDFFMEGQVEIVRGAYNFNLYNIINKEFLIRPGGTITWTGDPYQGVMNITATYTQNVNLTQNIIPGLTNVNGNTNIRLPVTAVMILTGNLLTPQIKLDLEFVNTPSDQQAVLSAFLTDIRNDQDELNRQVFSLLILKRLSERNNFGNNAVSQGITGSISELVTNQLSNWLSQVDNNLEVDIGVQGAIDQSLINNLQVRLSYSLLEGRLRLTREGGVNNNYLSNQGFTGNQSSLAGDWRAEYYLGRNGKVRLRLEYNTTPRMFSTTNSTVTRASVLHTEQFDNLRELFGRRRLRRRYQQAQRERLILDSDIRFDQVQ
ncbi:translocation/assembly module TamB domain-containing protein [Adhaeribacter aquaticus]|uniref:translocation/assembly module TamB domain-containing protein n=1 Tax=Adhaeribacter aquaticus TaxID=299567 RepID=UPI00040E3301|nr:translocation/assembly module TamB domain-containing protein [Adhaeribacter aquaticus]